MKKLKQDEKRARPQELVRTKDAKVFHSDDRLLMSQGKLKRCFPLDHLAERKLIWRFQSVSDCRSKQDLRRRVS